MMYMLIYDNNVMWLLSYDDMMYMLINVKISYDYKDIDSIFQIILLFGGIRYTSHHIHLYTYFAFALHSYYTHMNIHILEVSKCYNLEVCILLNY